MAIDWTKIYKQYKGLWVALKQDEKTVVASGKTAEEALHKAKEKGYPKPILALMPEKLATYVGYEIQVQKIRSANSPTGNSLRNLL